MRNSVLRRPVLFGVVISLLLAGVVGASSATANAKRQNCEGLDEQACTQKATKLASSLLPAKRAQGRRLLSAACEFESASACEALHALRAR
jgi:hypothetical protein